MKIRPKIPMFQGGGLPSTVTWSDPKSNWFTRSGVGILEGTYNMLKPLYDKWKSSGRLEDYLAYKKAVDTLNDNQRYGYAPGHLKYLSGNNQIFRSTDTGAWLNMVRNNYSFINDSIGKNYNLYHVESSNPNSGDNATQGWKVDNLWAGETDDRTTWGNLLDSNNPLYLEWKKKFSDIGIDYRTNPEWKTGDVLYGFLKDEQSKNVPPSATINPSKSQLSTEDLLNKLRALETGDPPEKESFLNKLTQGFNKIAPELLEGIRLAGALGTNSRVLAESEKAVIPNLLLTYQTHRQIVGDEATKQAYYRRAAQGLTLAAKPFTSDADRLMAYMMEAKRVGDELRALGDLADNQEIRRTSDESNQHQWANTQRATEVANSNITELNKAAAAKHQLRALKYLADWTNIDQYLLGRQAKIDLKRNKDLAYLQLLLLLLDLHEIATDEKLLRLKAEADAAYDTYYNNPTNIANYNTYKAKLKAYQDYLYEVQKRILSRRQFAKSGTKIEYKDKTAKYLYKTSKDIVEHFRRMSKMTDDSRIRTLPKPIKLSSHPRKMLMGGVAPFYIYRPYTSGMEQSMSSQVSASGTSSSSKKDNEGKDKLDMIKELFKAIQGQGLPIDVSTVYLDISKVLSKAKAFGEDLSTDDIASMYLNSMLKINNLKYSKDVFDKAKAQATANDALNEYAVTAGGALVLLNKEGEVKLGTYLDYVSSKGKWNPITNDQLLNLRAYSPNMALFKGDELMLIVNNGVGMTKIAALIKSMASTLGSSELKIEGISEVQNNKIKAGLLILAGTDGTPDGFYKVTLDKKDSSANVKAALTYIYSMLPNNYKTVLKMHSGSEDNSKALIASMLSSQISDYYKEDVAPLTGKASDKDKETSMDKLGINSATQLLLGMSSPREFAFSIGNGNMFNGMARVSSITKDGNPIGADFAYSDIYKSDLHKNLDLDNASFGDVPINKALKDRIIIDNSTIAGIDLPYTTDRNGRIIPDFLLLNRIEEADLEVLRAGINPETDPQKVNEIYAKHNLPIKYGADNRLTGNYKRFAVVLATAIEDVFLDKSGLASNGTLSLVSDEDEITKYVNEIKKTTGQKDIDMDRPGLFTGDKDVYKGSIFIPIIGDLVDAVSATGGLKAGNYDELRSKYLTKNYNEAPLFVKQ